MGDRWLLVEPGGLTKDATVELDPEEAHHARSVLRLRPGDPVVLADGAGLLARATVVVAERGRVAAEVVDLSRADPPSSSTPTLAHGVLAGRGMDWAVQKAVEIGVGSFRPVVALRSQLSVKAVRGRMDHWRRIARQALKQCRRPWAMELLEPADVAEVVAAAPGGGVVADPAGAQVWELPEAALDQVLVGPEGGLAPPELEVARRHGWPGVVLGAHVLRSETAAVLAAAVVGLERSRRRAAARS